MNIYTSYFANFKNIPDYWTQISIARYPPRYFKGNRFNLLAPDKHTIKWEWNNFKAAYLEKLHGIDPLETLKALEELSGGRDVILIGYGKSPESDTRGLITQWLFETTGNVVTELEIVDPYMGSLIQMIMEF